MKRYLFLFFLKLFFIIFLKKIIGYKTWLISSFLLISGEKAVGEAGKIETSGKNLNNNLREIFFKKIKDLKIAENGVGKAFIASLIFFYNFFQKNLQPKMFKDCSFTKLFIYHKFCLTFHSNFFINLFELSY